MLLSYLFLHVTHLQRSLSRFTRNTLIEAAILFPGQCSGWYNRIHFDKR